MGASPITTRRPRCQHGRWASVWIGLQRHWFLRRFYQGQRRAGVCSEGVDQPSPQIVVGDFEVLAGRLSWVGQVGEPPHRVVGGQGVAERPFPTIIS